MLSGQVSVTPDVISGCTQGDELSPVKDALFFGVCIITHQGVQALLHVLAEPFVPVFQQLLEIRHQVAHSGHVVEAG